MTAATITQCGGGCGRAVERQLVPGGGAIAEAANSVELWCEACTLEEQERLTAQTAPMDERKALALHRRRLGASGLPANLRHIDLDRLDQAGCEQAIDAARRWAAGEIRGLLFTGPFGTGKTTIAAGALRLLLIERPGRWISVPELFRRLGASLGDQERAWALGVVAGRRALVLDDIDKARPTEYGAEQVFLAIDNAVAHDQQLLVTTNLSVGQLAQKWPEPFGKAIASRLVGHCAGVQVTGADRRMRRPS